MAYEINASHFCCRVSFCPAIARLLCPNNCELSKYSYPSWYRKTDLSVQWCCPAVASGEHLQLQQNSLSRIRTSCVDVRFGIYTDGAVVQMYVVCLVCGLEYSFILPSFGCHGGLNQKFIFKQGPTTIQVAGTNFCFHAGSSESWCMNRDDLMSHLCN